MSGKLNSSKTWRNIEHLWSNAIYKRKRALLRCFLIGVCIPKNKFLDKYRRKSRSSVWGMCEKCREWWIKKSFAYVYQETCIRVNKGDGPRERAEEKKKRNVDLSLLETRMVRAFRCWPCFKSTGRKLQTFCPIPATTRTRQETQKCLSRGNELLLWEKTFYTPAGGTGR